MEVMHFSAKIEGIEDEPTVREEYAPVMMLPRAWRQSMGENVMVAVIDTGFDYAHVDLEEAFIDCGSKHLDDSIGHGTHVSGIIAARLNGYGVAGVAPHAFIVPYRAIPGSWMDVTNSLRDAIAKDVDIVNMSFGAPEPPPDYFYDAIEEAYQKGIVLVSAAGNSGDQMTYPARCDKVVPVAAVNPDWSVAPFSSHGDELERGFCAVGVNVLSTWPHDRYATLSGTSMACPQIVGLFALTIAKHRAKEGSTPIGPKGPKRVDNLIDHLIWASHHAGNSYQFGHGYIDGSKTL